MSLTVRLIRFLCFCASIVFFSLWHQHSACSTNTLHVAPTLCMWHQHSACGTNTLHVAPTLCMWHQHSACVHQHSACVHTHLVTCARCLFLWPTVFSVSTRLESVVRKQRQQQLDLSAILNQSAVSWEVVAPLFLVWGL